MINRVALIIRVNFIYCLNISYILAQGFIFNDESELQGLSFIHDHGGTDQRFYIETIGAGVCLFDFDNDEDLDLYFCQGSPLPGWDKDLELENKLFRNDNGQWTDVTSDAGVGDRSYSMGCACGDIDNDGDTDLYVSNFGNDVFYRNDGDGTFTDVSDEVGINNPLWGCSVALFDMDNDGLLDIYTTNYVDYSIDNNPWCGIRRTELRDYCKPDFFIGVEDQLLKNLGNWKFDDVSNVSGISGNKGKGLGVIPADFDQDGDMDLYVANDGVMNHYYINDGKGYFEENAIFTGAGFNENGIAEAGMGVDIGDINGDGWQDIFVTNFSGESNTVYVNNKRGYFDDETIMAGINQPSLDYVGFGTKLIDLDNDGWLDIFVVNGHVAVHINEMIQDYSHAQKKQIFLNNKNGTFREVLTEKIGDAGSQSVGRGAAFGDIDNDGDIDAIVSNNNGPANLLIREGKPINNWIGFDLEGIGSNRDAIGARVLLVVNGKKQTRVVNTAGSYLASNDKRVLFGMDKNSKAQQVTIYWPSGRIDNFKDLEANHYFKVKEDGTISPIKY